MQDCLPSLLGQTDKIPVTEFLSPFNSIPPLAHANPSHGLTNNNPYLLQRSHNDQAEKEKKR